MNTVQRIASVGISTLTLVTLGTSMAMASSGGDRFEPLPQSPRQGTLIAASTSDMGWMGKLSSNTLEQLIQQAQVGKKN
ncbi:MAG: hypothetical protein NW237_05370 [Cyanobacteriota bacterium]|nr:hypothetical protein [Cyanobacteriota bacterium]